MAVVAIGNSVAVRKSVVTNSDNSRIVVVVV